MVYEFLGLLVESYGTWLLLQRLVDASKDSDIPINNRNTLELAQIATVDKRMWKDSFSQIRKFEYSIRIRTLCFSQYSNLESSFVAIRSLLVYIPTAKMIVNIWKVTSRGNFPGSPELKIKGVRCGIKSDPYKLFINLTLLGHVTENFNF